MFGPHFLLDSDLAVTLPLCAKWVETAFLTHPVTRWRVDVAKSHFDS